MKQGDVKPGRIYTAGKGVHGPDLFVTGDPVEWNEPEQRYEKRTLNVTAYILRPSVEEDENPLALWPESHFRDWRIVEPRQLGSDVGAADELQDYADAQVASFRERERLLRERRQNAEELRHLLQEYVGATDDTRGWGWGDRVEIPRDYHRPIIEALKR